MHVLGLVGAHIDCVMGHTRVAVQVVGQGLVRVPIAVQVEGVSGQGRIVPSVDGG